MNKLGTKERAQILTLLVEGMSINAVARVTGASKVTILKLLADVGAACAAYQDRVLRNLNCRRVEADEIWAFCYSKAKNVLRNKRQVEGAGDAYTWTAIDADSKLVFSWVVGPRDGVSGHEFVRDFASRLAQRIQLTTDGLAIYREAVEKVFGRDIDFAQLVKIFGTPPEKAEQRRYSPPECVGAEKIPVTGAPWLGDVSTSYVERQNLTMRMHMRRFTRLTNGFSKKLENHMHAISLHFLYYNFCRIHKTLRVTPAMEAGIDDHVWTMEEVVMMADTL